MKKIILALGLVVLAGSAFAQTPHIKPLTGNLGNDLGITRFEPKLTGNPLNDIIGALDIKLLPDLQYAQKLAEATGSRVTAPCYGAWVAIIQSRQKAVEGMEVPNPHIVTDFEKLVELRNALQPDSDFMVKCSPVASMVRKDIVSFMATVIAGGAGLAALGL